MMRTVVIFIFFITATISWSQDSALIGYWKLQTVQINNQLIFDSKDSSVLYESIYQLTFKDKAVITKKDSILAEEKAHETMVVMSMTFIDFQTDGRLDYGFMIETPKGVKQKVFDGLYEIDGNKYRISLFTKGESVNIIEGHFTLDGATLTMFQKNWENSYNVFVKQSR
jgi:hypothetical protein